MNYQQKVIQYVIGIVTSCGGNDIIVKRGEKVLGKDIWETLDVITLITLIGVDNYQTILHMSKRIIRCYFIDKSINQFEIGYMISPPLHFNRVPKEQYERCLSDTFYEKTMEILKKF